AIVRNIDQHIRSLVCEAARNRWIGRLDADENAGAQISQRHQTIVGAGSKITNDCPYQTRARHPFRQRNILAKWQQANLIILSNELTLFIYEHGGIVNAVVGSYFLR